MKTRMIAITAAILLAAASVIPMMGACAETAETVTTPTAITETAPATTEEQPAAPTAAEEQQPATTPAAAEEKTVVDIIVANVKTHHRFTEVANRFQVKVGKVSPRTHVCMWTTDCRKANTKLRRLDPTETLTVVAQSNGWYKVVDSHGVTGFVVRSRVAVA